MILSILYTQGLFQKLCIPISLRKAKINSQNRHSRFDSGIVYISSTTDIENGRTVKSAPLLRRAHFSNLKSHAV